MVPAPVARVAEDRAAVGTVGRRALPGRDADRGLVDRQRPSWAVWAALMFGIAATHEGKLAAPEEDRADVEDDPEMATTD